MRLCDICSKNGATRFETFLEGGAKREYAYCEACYQRALSYGREPRDVARERQARKGLECPSCGCTAEDFANGFLFGCPSCYKNMRGVAGDALAKLRMSAGGTGMRFDSLTDEERARVKDYVVSSRVRLARNVDGLPFPNRLRDMARSSMLRDDDRRGLRALLKGALLATRGVFDGELFEMSELDSLKKKMLIERHVISLPLANSEFGAVIIERGEGSGISIMLGEEDHVRAQCVRQGLAIAEAYARLKRYDENLGRQLPIARSAEWGYLTACPTNVGTGMRASAMVFLPALRCLGKLDVALNALKNKFGITVRGYYGEGSDAAYDMYQVSNGDTLILDAKHTVALVETATMELCALESAATRELVRAAETKLFDKIQRSYGTLLHAHTLESDEMFELLTDVRLGVRLGLFDIRLEQLDGIMDDLATAFEILSDGLGAERRGICRAAIVRERLGAK